MDNFIQLLLFEKNKALPFIDDVANLRISIFREYPYLYEGNVAYEKNYLEKFVRSKDSIFVIAFDGQDVIGALTGLPLSEEEPNIQEPWLKHNFDISSTYYFSEALIYEKYRGQGLGIKMFDIAEKWATKKYNHLTLASVIRKDNHPLKPINYHKIDAFWEKLGYQKEENIICKILWKEINAEQESNKPLIFWSKKH